MQALTTNARDAIAAQLAQADLDAVPVPEAIARIARVMAAGGTRYAALIRRFGASDYAGEAEQQIGALLRGLLQRGIDDGTFRGDLTAEELLSPLGCLLEGAARMTAQHEAGVEKAAALVPDGNLGEADAQPPVPAPRSVYEAPSSISPAAFAIDLAPVRVNAVCPGMVLTEIVQRAPAETLRAWVAGLP